MGSAKQAERADSVTSIGGERAGEAGFARIASRYDAWYSKPANRFIDSLERRSLKEILPAAAGDSLLLDVGTGTGHWLSLGTDAGYNVFGLDKSMEMLRVAVAKAGSRVRLIQGDALRLPFRDACFDSVLSVTTLEFVSGAVRALDEMTRCLKPGGTLVLGVLNAVSYLGLRRKILRSPTFRDAHFFTVAELKRMLSGSGTLSIGTCAFMPPWEWILPLGDWLEKAGKVLAPASGQLIVAALAKPHVGGGTNG
jgi:ubiquinone/menaquinone biosynthesis C-methylase UbiE